MIRLGRSTSQIANIRIIDIHTQPKIKVLRPFLRFNGITRIIRFSYKSNSPDLYETFSRIVSDLGHYFEGDEFENKLSP
jgi:hypothetical protein